LIPHCQNGKPHPQLKTDHGESTEKYREDMKKLLKTVHLPLLLERKQNFQQLYNDSPAATNRFLKELYKMKKSKQLGPSRKMLFQRQFCRTENMCHKRILEIQANDAWKARVSIVPINGKTYRVI